MNDNCFLDLLEKTLDDNQRLCCTVRENAVVKAGAGSGKTQVFSNRFSWLIMRDENPLSIERILTLTFTNKAASEMYQRIYSTLKNYADTDISDVNNRKLITDVQIERARKALKSFSNAHIQTLDSYCGDLVRKHASKLGIPQNFAIAAKENDRFLEQQVFSFVINNKTNVGLQHFVKPGKFEDFSLTIAELLKNHTSLSTEDNFFSRSLEKQRDKIDSEERKIEELKDRVREYDLGSKYYKDVLAVINSETDSFWKMLIEVASIRQSGNDEGFKKFVRDEFKNKEELAEAAISFKNEYSFMQEFCTLLDGLLKAVNENKRKTGSLSFKDVQDLALKLLKTDKSVQKEESDRFDQIMIDEFQDNNIDNRDMLLLLCGVPSEDLGEGKKVCEYLRKYAPEKLYFVGDEKQSIYRFRDADVKVFNSLENLIGQEKGKLFMSYNYRSSGDLISSFNLIFGGLETRDQDKIQSEPYDSILKTEDSSGCEAGFPLTAYIKKKDKTLPIISEENCKVEMWLLDDSVKESEEYDEERQYSFIADKISELVKEGASYSDIAILDKSRTKRGILCRYLTKNGIPFILDEEKELFSDGPVNDIFNILQLMCNIKNDGIMGSFLCSPYVGMSVNEAINCLSAVKEKKKFENDRYGEAQKLLEEIKKRRFDSITEILNYLWFDLGYVYNTRENKVNRSFEKQFDILFELARQADEMGKNLFWYTTQLGKRKTKEESFLESMEEDSELDVENVKCPFEQSDAVQIMTIHKSKGLQFKIVFALGCLADNSKQRSGFCFSDRENGIAFTSNSGKNFFFLKQRDTIKEETFAEFKRLIYVALTRAEERVFLIGKKSNLDKGNSPWPKNDSVFYYKKESIDNYSYKPDLEKVTKPDGKDWKEKESFSPIKEKRISPSAMEVLFQENPDRTEKNVPFSEVNEIISKSVSFKLNDFGTLAHKVMENLVNGIDNLTYDWNELCFVIEPEHLNRLVDIAVEMSKAFINTKLYDEIKRSDFRRTEWSFKSFKKNSYINGSIDLLFRDSEGHYSIVDYKTAMKSDNKEKFIRQQKLYREIGADLIRVTTGENVKEEDISCYLYYLRYGKTVDITNDCNNTQVSEQDIAEAIDSVKNKDMYLELMDSLLDVARI